MIAFDLIVARGAFSAHYRGELGAITAISGPSGSGKTTLLDAIAGLVPAEGTCTIDGVALSELPAHRRGIGYAFQDDRLFPHLAVQENLLFAGRRARFDEIVEALELEPLLARKPRDLSGGEKKRAGIARALLAAERLLLLDEPLSPLDTALRERVAQLIRATDLPILVVTHEQLTSAPSGPVPSREIHTLCAPPDRAP